MNFYVAWFIGGFLIPALFLFAVVLLVNLSGVFNVDIPLLINIIICCGFGVMSFIIDPMIA